MVEKMNMKRNIFLKSLQDVNEFVTIAEKCDFPIEVQLENAQINAKSFMGMVSQATGKPVTIEYDEIHQSFNQAIDKYAV